MMDQNVEQLTSTLDLIKNEVQKFLHQHEHQNSNAQTKRQKSSCNGTILAQKLMQIIENEEESRGVQSPEEKAMSNSLVVRKILSNLNVQDLFRFRQVSRLWREEATSVLSSQRHRDQREEFLCVKFKASAHSKNYCHDNGGTLEEFLEEKRSQNYCHDNGGTLEEFLEESSQNPQLFIYSGIIFEGGDFQLYPALDRFFSEFGSRIQHLNLSLEFLDVPKFRQVLLEFTPNLKSLILEPENFLWKLEPLKPEDPRLSLPKLKQLTLPKIRLNPVDLISEIMTSAENLTSVKDPHLIYVDEIISAGKLSLVKSLTLSFYRSTEQEVESLLRFVAAGPKLTSLTLRDLADHDGASYLTDPRIILPLLMLLDLGQNSLEKGTGFEILRQLSSDPSIPVDFVDRHLSSCPNLTELQVSTDHFLADNFLPGGHDLSRIAPNLKTLHFTAEKSEIYRFTSPSNAHESLQNLKVSISAYKLTRQHVRQWIQTLGGHYPNITHLDISIKYKGEENIPECLKLIPRYFKNLKELVLRCWIAGQTKAKWNLDPAITGISKEECNKLEEKDEQDLEYQKLEVLDQIRTSLSILDLKKLRNLTFEVEFKGKVQPLWSHVTQLYAFQPMAKRQGLEVKVSGFYNNNNRVQLTGNDLGPL